jgi:hypothetical protein
VSLGEQVADQVPIEMDICWMYRINDDVHGLTGLNGGVSWRHGLERRLVSLTDDYAC